MTAIEIARRMAELGVLDKALEAYQFVLRQGTAAHEEQMEAACAILQLGGDYRIAYNAFLTLFGEGVYQNEILSILDGAFYEPNVQEQEKLYRRNCNLLMKYPYLFRKDFLPFEELPVRFYPYDDNGVLPFCVSEARFDPYINVNQPEIRHHFFGDLSKPILARDIFSQYELMYLRDNVRRSDWVGYENHIYLHYSDWGEFCAYLQCLDLKPLLEDQKFVFLIGEEEALYPIDFKERFGVDYSIYSAKPFQIREINKIIWHTQLSAHNGGDYFNEIFHEHPNLIGDTSILFPSLVEALELIQNAAYDIRNSKGQEGWSEEMRAAFDPAVLDQLTSISRPTKKDVMVAYYLGKKECAAHLDRTARIVPALFFQPHFGRVENEWNVLDNGVIAITNHAENELRESGLMDGFPYIKTFTPLRRPTTSYGATVKFNWRQYKLGIYHQEVDEAEKEKPRFFDDGLMRRMLNRSFMVAPGDPLYADSRIIRFEDAKLEPTASFTALAGFLDVPYTDSMTYCSDSSGRDPRGVGFSTEPVYRKYEKFFDNNERKLLEYMFSDVYRIYGYNYEQYDGEPMEPEQLEELLKQCKFALVFVKKTWLGNREKIGKQIGLEGEALDQYIIDAVAKVFKSYRAKRRQIAHAFHKCTAFCNERGEWLVPMKLLELDPNLMESPIYH